MHPDSLHRLMKSVLDNGEASSIEEASSLFASYGIQLVLSISVQFSNAEQIIALTVINTAARSFLGNVQVVAEGDFTLTAPGFVGRQLSEFCKWSGVGLRLAAQASWPAIQIGGNVSGSLHSKAIRPWARGWTFGVGGSKNSGENVFPAACVAAGALAVSEAFSIMRRDNPYAGRRDVGFSLWSMSGDTTDENGAPWAGGIDSGLWLVGLGHLGQAYAWTLGFMQPSGRPSIILQDVDRVTDSTLSTSVLSAAADLGHRKTRIVAHWLDNRGFDTRVVERLFDSDMRVAPTEPAIALFGVDNAAARRCCEYAGFRLVLDAGLGSGYRDFKAMRVRAFPGSTTAQELWAADTVSSGDIGAAAYQQMLRSGADPCGVTTLATRAVGASFVGCYAAALLVAELVRRNHTGHGHEVLSLSLRDPLNLEKA